MKQSFRKPISKLDLVVQIEKIRFILKDLRSI